jgi:uncharacterized protein (TIGR02145 family)
MADKQWEHYGPDGEKTGESEQKETFLGKEHIEHRDSSGTKTGSSETKKTFFGKEYIEHRDDGGQIVGTSQGKKTFFGDEYIEKKDENGNVIGTARKKKSFAGEEYVEHRDSSGRVIGKSFLRDKSSSFWIVLIAIAVALILFILALTPIILGIYLVKKGRSKTPDWLKWVFVGICYLFGVSEFRIFTHLGWDIALLPLIIYSAMGMVGTLLILLRKRQGSDGATNAVNESLRTEIVIGSILLALGVGLFFMTIPSNNSPSPYESRSELDKSNITEKSPDSTNETDKKAYNGSQRPPEPVNIRAVATDADGNAYQTVKIGNQVWMAENLRTTKFNDGSAIPLVTDKHVWSTLTTPGYCWYTNNSSAYKNPYGALYNWYAVNTYNLAPTGWHVPTDADWTVLTRYLGGESEAGSKLKEAGHSSPLNSGATNEIVFLALPGGCRDNYGKFYSVGIFGYWWSSTDKDSTNSWYRDIGVNNATVFRDYDNHVYGFSVRCVKDP